MFYDKIKLLILQILLHSKTPINLMFKIQTIKTIVASFIRGSFIRGVWYNDIDYFSRFFI